MVSVKFGSGQDDLKNIISKKGRRQHNADEKLPPGEPCLEMYLKLSDSFMRKGRFDVALYHIGEAADFNPESPVKQAFAGTELLETYHATASYFFQLVLMAAGRCHARMGNWEAALGSAELVLKKEAKNPGAVLIKAEALFNLCDFEHSLLHFCRGQVIFIDTFLFLLQLLREPTISEMVFVKTSHF